MKKMERHDGVNSLQSDINNLVRDLRQEKLFVSCEQKELQTLNKKVENDSQKLAQAAWVTAQQRLNLNKLILAKPDSSPAICCQKAISLERIKFVDVHKVLLSKDCPAYGDFLQTLRTSPELLAQCLAVGESVASAQLVEIVPSLTSGLYGSLTMPHDTVLVLRLLKELTRLQLVSSDNPQRVLRHGLCSFTKIYTAFHEALFSAKLFLTASLQRPILHLLTELEYFLDIDPDKAVIRFPQSERIKKFGKEGTAEFTQRVAKYRKWTVNALFTITTKFITSLQENMHCFPAPLSWLIRQIANLLTKSEKFTPKEINATIIDLVFTYFICPAMVNPEPYGITDAPISYISRFNLIQVAQIVQMLALIKYQDIDPKVNDLYSRFDKNCVTSLIDDILSETEGCNEEIPLTLDGSDVRGLNRSAALFTEAELYNLVDFLHVVLQSLNESKIEEAAAIMPSESNCDKQDGTFTSHDKEKLGLLINSLPTRPVKDMKKSFSDSSIKQRHENHENGHHNDTGRKGGILGKVSNKRLKAVSLSTNMLSHGSSDHCTNSNNSLKSDDSYHHRQNSYNSLSSRPSSSESEESYASRNHEVLVIPLNLPQSELVGLLPEHKVLSMDLTNGYSSSTNLDSVTLTNNVEDFISEPDPEDRNQIPPDENGLPHRLNGQEKRTRFSHSLDDGSIGNTSDNLEAISEAASNHSVASSLELENEDQNDNDNLSDMISANVSGRGTPNISGRDTPSSQVTEGDDQGRQNEQRQPYLPPPQSIMNKQIRSEIDDKFCKFEIKKLLEGDETVSIISDTWSTDVLASDSETVETVERERERFLPLVSERIERANVIELDGVETASESAWSTDVLASDSERMTEVDIDDTVSVAPSDDTASVARSDDTARSEIEDTPPVHLHRPIPISIPGSSRNNQSSNHSSAHSNQHNGPVSASSSQPGSPMDVSSPHLSSFNSYIQSSPVFVGNSNISFSPNNAFRPIRDDRSSGTPNSPLRQITPPDTNKGGRKLDYQRRSLEYVDNNANNIHSEIISDPSRSSSSTLTPETVVVKDAAARKLTFNTSSQTMENYIQNQCEQFQKSVSYNITSQRKEAVFVDSNAIATNGLELFVQEPEDSNVLNSTYKSVFKAANFGLCDVKSINEVNFESNDVNKILNEPEFEQNDVKILNNSNNVKIINFDSNEITFKSNETKIETQNTSKTSSDMSDMIVRLSNVSINSMSSVATSSSSSSNSETNQNQTNDWNIRNSEYVPNGTLPNMSQTGVNGHQVKPTSSAIKPTSTGAIPKSISFDMSAEKGDKDSLDDEQKNKRGFFGKLKMGFKNRRGKSFRNEEGRYEDTDRFKRYTLMDDVGNKCNMNTETSEDILAKYCKKPSSNMTDSLTAESAINMSNNRKSKSNMDSTEDERWTIDQNNVEACFAFTDVKRKLRLVFNTAMDVGCPAYGPFHRRTRRRQHNNHNYDNELVSFLRVQLAKAQNLSDWSLVALISETLRCVSLFDITACRKLLSALKQDHSKRAAYITYLVRCRQELLSTLAHLDSVRLQIMTDRELSTNYLVTVCVRIFLDKRENAVRDFCEEFRNLTMADEKTDLLNTFLESLTNDMEHDSNWRDSSSNQLELARVAVERILISRVYIHALFPNGDGDLSRDHLLQEHIKKLSKIITPNHKDLRIHKMYHYECPWPSAQDAISTIAAYKLARDKVRCIVRCARCIMHLLSLSSETGSPAADDFMPVLVYILIKANPPSLLSTIQYVNSFYGPRLEGEEAYYWTQFCSAVEFIKTMEYSE